MQVVVGSSPLAIALAAALAREGPTALASPTQREGAFLWRLADPDSGEGILPTVRAAQRVFVVVDGNTEHHGLFVVLRRLKTANGVVVAPAGIPFPSALAAFPGWSRVEIGACWGSEEPLVQRWSAAVRTGRWIWSADPGVIAALSMPDAVAGIQAAGRRPGAQWKLLGSPWRLPDLLKLLGEAHGRSPRTIRAPLSLAMRRIGVDPDRVRAWTRLPHGDWHTPGYAPPAPLGSAGFLAGLHARAER